MDKLCRMRPDDDDPEYPFGLNEVSASIYVLSSTHGAMMNGGLRYFFSVEHPGDLEYDEICSIYRRIEAPKVAECISDASRIFRFSNPHLKADERNETMWRLEQGLGCGEMLFDDMDRIVFDEDLDEKIVLYMRRHANLLEYLR